MFNPNQNQNLTDQLSVDRKNLYREETFSDLQMATIKHLIPVTSDGSMDQTRPIMFIGHTQLMTQAGVLPVQCPIEASTLEEAMDNFPQAINKAVEKMIEEAKDLQRQQASRIVVPGANNVSKIIT
ncbi:MAG: cytoplasmic protein [Deltaproteobacteria bacterium]|nr:cytoplasmic protein [Candidatus Tharpellaceae bacterium]